MLLHTVMPGEFLATELTHVRFLTRVNSHMFIVMSPMIEPFHAYFTLDVIPENLYKHLLNIKKQ